MNYRNGDNKGTKKPVRHVDVLGFAFHDSAKEHNRIGHPDDSHKDIDRPLHFGIFFAAGVTQRQADDGQQDDQLPAPEGKLG